MNDLVKARVDDVDAEIRRFVTAIHDGYRQFADFDSLPLAERRRAAEQVRAPWAEGGPRMWRSTDLSIAGRPARIHTPIEGDLRGALLYLHGGGWTMFSINTHDRLMREYASRAQVIVVGLDYSLSPEARFPTALHDVIAAIDWLGRDGRRYGIDPRQLAVGGDSAGANLAIAAAIARRDAGTQDLKAMVLNYGAYATEFSAQSRRFDGPDYLLNTAEMDYFWRNYARNAGDYTNPLFAPILANLTGLPPANLTFGCCDILAECNLAMADRLRAAGVPVLSNACRGATHSFLEAAAISSLADRAIGQTSDWLRSTLAANL
ncbi:MAG: alpha/beta hydrolase [Steroidobacteraceae bacterium]